MNPKSINILGVDFDYLSLDQDKVLLQLNPSKEKTYSVPLIGQAIIHGKIPTVKNVIAAESEILIYCQIEHQARLINGLKKLQSIDVLKKRKQMKLDVCFELALDWDRVCEKLKEEKETIISKLMSGSYPLINYGFQPGFMYLDSLDEQLHVPRLDKPRLSIPAGSLAIGGKYLGVYGSSSPGGWNIIGLTPHIVTEGSDFEKFPQIGQVVKLNRLSEKKYLRKHHHE